MYMTLYCDGELSNLRSVQVLPFHPAVQLHSLGAVQFPPFSQTGLHIADIALYVYEPVL